MKCCDKKNYSDLFNGTCENQIKKFDSDEFREGYESGFLDGKLAANLGTLLDFAIILCVAGIVHECKKKKKAKKCCCKNSCKDIDEQEEETEE